MKSVARIDGVIGLESEMIFQRTAHRRGKQVGYVFENREFYAPKVVYELQRRGFGSVRPTVRSNLRTKRENGRWAMVPTQVLTHNQPLPSDVLYATLDELAKNTGVDIYSANTGLMADVDFGSPAFKPLSSRKWLCW